MASNRMPSAGEAKKAAKVSKARVLIGLLSRISLFGGVVCRRMYDLCDDVGLLGLVRTW